MSKLCFSRTFLLVALWLGLQSCGTMDAMIAQAEGRMTFKLKNDWQYAAKITPTGMMQEVVKTMLQGEWLGDPNRFSVLKIKEFGQEKALYFISPMIPCPEGGCASQALFDLYRPTCGATGWCSYFAYVDEGDGTYRQVFRKHLLRRGGKDFLKVSAQLKDGLPACLELLAFDSEAHNRGLVHFEPETEFVVSRYCYNGEEYTLKQIYQIPQGKN